MAMVKNCTDPPLCSGSRVINSQWAATDRPMRIFDNCRRNSIVTERQDCDQLRNKHEWNKSRSDKQWCPHQMDVTSGKKRNRKLKSSCKVTRIDNQLHWCRLLEADTLHLNNKSLLNIHIIKLNHIIVVCHHCNKLLIFSKTTWASNFEIYLTR